MPADRSIHIALHDQSYDVTVRRGLLADIGGLLRRLNTSGKAIVITDNNIATHFLGQLRESLQAEGFSPHVTVLPSGEEQKAIENVVRLYDQILPLRVDRQTPIIAMGGGVVGDIAGFVASTVLRGLPFVQVPTTLLSMVDASVGGKTGVNHRAGKNLIGAFHQPIAVFIDPSVLRTLPPREVRSGLAECIKHDVIRDDDGFANLESNIARALSLDLDYLTELIAHNVEIKAKVVMADPFERGERAHLNFGHTFGHAIETTLNYSKSHGECIGLGMTAAAKLATDLKMIDDGTRRRIVDVIKSAQLPTHGLVADPNVVLNAMSFDKKSKAGKLRFILPDRIGHVVIRDDVASDLVRDALESLMDQPMALKHWLQLALTDGIGPVLQMRLIKACGDVGAACEANASTLRNIEGIGAAKSAQIYEALKKSADQVHSELAKARDTDVELICIEDETYPALLREIPDPPAVLYVKGKLEPRDLNSVAIVGSRKCSFYGREQAERFGALLAGAAITVVSGGARGIDSAAHRGAMSHERGRTLAVLGSGVDIAYPPENAALFDQIAQRGAVVSEYPLGTPPIAENFPRRNRIVSGMTRGVLVIEADERSGALITARQACDDHGRPVFAIPGRVDNKLSIGPHKLIRDGATLVTNLEEILEELGPLPHSAIVEPELCSENSTSAIPEPQAPTEPVGMSDQQRSILLHLDEPLHVDAIIERTTLPAHQVLQELTFLSLRGLVRREGQHYARRS